MDKQVGESFHSPESFLTLHVTQPKICLYYAGFTARISQIIQIYLSYAKSIAEDTEPCMTYTVSGCRAKIRATTVEALV
jgi:hypothetical protein